VNRDVLDELGWIRTDLARQVDHNPIVFFAMDRP
jgi:hypothetical protein